MKKIYQDKFFRQSILIFFLSTGGSFFNFLYQYLMSHTLTKADYGLLNSLLSFYSILTIPITTLQMIISKYVSEYKAKAQWAELKYFFSVWIKDLFFVSIVFLALVFFFQHHLSHFFHISSPFIFLLIGCLVVVWLLLYLGFGFLRGFQQFLGVGICLFLVGFLKWLGGVSLRFSEYNMANIISMMLISSLMVLLIIIYTTEKWWVWPFGREHHFKKNFRYIIPSLISYSLLSIILSIDLILVQHFWGSGTQSHETGLYATAAILGKTVFYLSLSVIMVMFPQVAQNAVLNKPSKTLLLKALGFSACISGGALSLFMFFPEFILEFFGKKEALAAIPYLRLYAIAMFFMALLYILVNYSIALSQFKFLKILIGMVILEVSLMYCFHDTPFQILWILIGLVMVSVFSLFMMLRRVLW